MRLGIIGFLVFAFIGMTLLDGVMQGSGGILATGLTGDITAGVLTIPANTEGFPPASASNPQLIFIEDEQIVYTGYTATQFTIPTNGRGVNSTTSKSHTEGTMVYNQEAAMINETAGFNVIQANTEAGMLNMAWNTAGFLLHALPNMLTWNFSYLSSGPASYIALFLKAISTAITVGLGLMFIYIVFGRFGK